MLRAFWRNFAPLAWIGVAIWHAFHGAPFGTFATCIACSMLAEILMKLERRE